MVLEELDFPLAPRGLYQGPLDLRSSQIVGVDHPTPRMAALLGQVVLAPLFSLVVAPGELDADLDQLPDALRARADDHLHRLLSANARARHKGVLDMALEAVLVVKHRRDAALGVASAGLGQLVFRHHRHQAGFGRFQREAETADPAAYHQDIGFIKHGSILAPPAWAVKKGIGYPSWPSIRACTCQSRRGSRCG